MQKLNRKSIRLEIRRGYGDEEDSVAKIWYSWNPIVLVWQKDRKHNQPAWTDDRQFVWYDRGRTVRHAYR